MVRPGSEGVVYRHAAPEPLRLHMNCAKAIQPAAVAGYWGSELELWHCRAAWNRGTAFWDPKGQVHWQILDSGNEKHDKLKNSLAYP